MKPSQRYRLNRLASLLVTRERFGDMSHERRMVYLTIIVGLIREGL